SAGDALSSNARAPTLEGPLPAPQALWRSAACQRTRNPSMTAAMLSPFPLNAGTAPLLKPVRAWLFGVAALVIIMVGVGGATRLTGSGPSITEWQPVLRTHPPPPEP